MTARRSSRAGAVALCLAAAASAVPAVATAAVISATPNAALSTVPFTVSLGGGAASYGFTAVSAVVTGSGPGAAVATGGTGLVSTFLGGVTDFSAGATIDGSGLYTFATSPAATLIPNSPADDFIGLAFTLGDGLHFGYAEVNGASVVSYGYESTPGATILAGATSVPEPASGALAVVGLAVAGAIRFRRRTRQEAPTA